MPTFVEVLLDAEQECCVRIAELCNERERVWMKLDREVAACRSLDRLLELELAARSEMQLIDKEIELRCEAGRKMAAQLKELS